MFIQSLFLYEYYYECFKMIIDKSQSAYYSEHQKYSRSCPYIQTLESFGIILRSLLIKNRWAIVDECNVVFGNSWDILSYLLDELG